MKSIFTFTREVNYLRGKRIEKGQEKNVEKGLWDDSHNSARVYVFESSKSKQELEGTKLVHVTKARTF